MIAMPSPDFCDRKLASSRGYALLHVFLQMLRVLAGFRLVLCECEARPSHMCTAQHACRRSYSQR